MYSACNLRFDHLVPVEVNFSGSLHYYKALNKSSLLIIQDHFLSYKLLVYSIRIDRAFVHSLPPSFVGMLSKSCVDPNSNNYHLHIVPHVFDNAFGRSCIRIVNKIRAITDSCGMPISIFLIDEYVFPARVQIIHLSDKKFLMY